MSKGSKVPHGRAHIPNSDKAVQAFKDSKTDSHINDNKKVSSDSHGIKGSSSTRSPNHK